jgi:hypothetical protein
VWAPFRQAEESAIPVPREGIGGIYGSCARYERSSKTVGSTVPPAAHRGTRL